MQFRIKAMAADLAVSTQTVEASDAAEARRLVEAGGLTFLSAQAVAGGGRAAGRGFNLVVFNQQLYSLLEAGQPVVDALEILGSNDRLGHHRAVYDSLLDALRGGKQLSAAMGMLPSIFPPLYVAIVRSSETTGAVRTAVQRYTQYQRQVDDIRRKLVAASIYPAVLLCVGFVVVAFLMLFVVPRFSAVFDDVGHGRTGSGFIQWWGGFVRNHALLAWSGVAAMGGALAAAIMHPGARARVRRQVLALPHIGEKLRLMQLARVYRTLGMLLHSGVSVLAAMRMTAETLGPDLRRAMERAVIEVGQGRPMSAVLSEGGLCTEVSFRLLLAGESSGNLDQMMEKIADFYDQDLATWIDTVGRLIEPVLMVAIGLVIGAVLLMLYMPIFDLTSTI